MNSSFFSSSSLPSEIDDAASSSSTSYASVYSSQRGRAATALTQPFVSLRCRHLVEGSVKLKQLLPATSSVTALDLSHNLITAWPSESLTGLPSLIALNLSHNRVLQQTVTTAANGDKQTQKQTQAQTLLPRLSQLLELRLASNQIASLDSFLSSATALRHLSLANNQLSVLHGLESLIHLQTLDLSHNLIAGSLRLLMCHKSLDELDLRGNPVASAETPKMAKRYATEVLKYVPSLRFLDGACVQNHTRIGNDGAGAGTFGQGSRSGSRSGSSNGSSTPTKGTKKADPGGSYSLQLPPAPAPSATATHLKVVSPAHASNSRHPNTSFFTRATGADNSIVNININNSANTSFGSPHKSAENESLSDIDSSTYYSVSQSTSSPSSLPWRSPPSIIPRPRSFGGKTYVQSCEAGMAELLSKSPLRKRAQDLALYRTKHEQRQTDGAFWRSHEVHRIASDFYSRDRDSQQVVWGQGMQPEEGGSFSSLARAQHQPTNMSPRCQHRQQQQQQKGYTASYAHKQRVAENEKQPHFLSPTKASVSQSWAASPSLSLLNMHMQSVSDVSDARDVRDARDSLGDGDGDGGGVSGGDDLEACEGEWSAGLDQHYQRQPLWEAKEEGKGCKEGKGECEHDDNVDDEDEEEGKGKRGEKKVPAPARSAYAEMLAMQRALHDAQREQQLEAQRLQWRLHRENGASADENDDYVYYGVRDYCDEGVAVEEAKGWDEGEGEEEGYGGIEALGYEEDEDEDEAELGYLRAHSEAQSVSKEVEPHQAEDDSARLAALDRMRQRRDELQAARPSKPQHPPLSLSLTQRERLRRES